MDVVPQIGQAPNFPALAIGTDDMPQLTVRKKSQQVTSTWVPSSAGLIVFLAQGFWRKCYKREFFLHHEKCNTGKALGTDNPQVSCSFSNIITPSLPN